MKYFDGPNIFQNFYCMGNFSFSVQFSKTNLQMLEFPVEQKLHFLTSSSFIVNQQLTVWGYVLRKKLI